MSMITSFIVIIWGRYSLAAPAYVIVAVTLLPYLYGILLLLSLILTGLHRKRKMPAVLTLVLFLTGFYLWGTQWLPALKKKGAGEYGLQLLSWNVQRVGEYHSGGRSIPEIEACISELIVDAEPDVMIFLEITDLQLNRILMQLEAEDDQTPWIDYHGTGKRSRSGLACVVNSRSDWRIIQEKDLDLPPGWKYLFVELCNSEKNPPLVLNLIALHLMPPGIAEKDFRLLSKGPKEGIINWLKEIFRMTRRLEHHTRIQGLQAEKAIKLIKNLKDPTIIAGDFNSTPDNALHRNMRRIMNDSWLHGGYGFGATRYWMNRLPLRIDYIYSSKQISISKSNVFENDCADHAAVVTEFSF
ncbi:MAG: endonuclease/exonuclease/phosphatase family protein [bacterium]